VIGKQNKSKEEQIKQKNAASNASGNKNMAVNQDLNELTKKTLGKPMTGILNKSKTEDSKLPSQDNKLLQIGTKTSASPPIKITNTQGTPLH